MQLIESFGVWLQNINPAIEITLLYLLMARLNCGMQIVSRRRSSILHDPGPKYSGPPGLLR